MSNKQLLSQKLITLTAEELKRAHRIAILSVSNKNSQKTPLSVKFLNRIHKTSAQRSPNRPKSRTEHKRDRFDKVLGEKLAEMIRNRKIVTPALKNYKTLINGYYNKGSINRSESKKSSHSKRSSSSKKRAKKKNNNKTDSDTYYTQNSLNINKFLKHEANRSPSLILGKARRVPKSIANNIDENGYIVKANNSYIHNLNVSPEGLFYSNSHMDSIHNDKAINKSVKAIEAKLEKRLVDANLAEGYEKQIKLLNAHKEALSSIIPVDSYFGNLLDRIKNSYESFIEVLIKKQEEEISTVKAELMNAMDVRIKDLSKNTKIPPHTKEIEKVKESPQKKVPLMNLKGLSEIKDYHDEFMEMEGEFSPSWRDKLAKEKRY